MIKSSNIFTSIGIPDRNYGRTTSRSYHIAHSLVELGHHEHDLEILKLMKRFAVLLTGLLKLLLVYFPHACVLVRRACDEFVTTSIPMDGYDKSVVFNLIGRHLTGNVRKHSDNLRVDGFVSKVPETRLVKVSTHEEKTLGWAELSPVDVSVAASRLWRTGKYDTLLVVCLQGYYLSYRCSRLSSLVNWVL